jgi:DNA polymerase-3 subunit epsilon
MAKLAAVAGCRVDDGVTKHTTLVVVGIQDAKRLKGAPVSSKHQKALDLIRKGKSLRIITESDLMLLLKHG